MTLSSIGGKSVLSVGSLRFMAVLAERLRFRTVLAVVSLRF